MGLSRINFSGCRVLAYCLMCNHVQSPLELPPMPEGGLSDAELLKRLRALYDEAMGGGAKGNGALKLAADWCGRSWRTRAMRRTVDNRLGS